MLKPVDTTPRARRTAVNARKQEKSRSQTNAGRSNGVASEHDPQKGKKGERGRLYAATTGAGGPDPRGRCTAGPARRRGGGAEKPSRAGTPKGAAPAAKSNGKPRSSIVVLETTSTIKATERDVRRNGHTTASATHPELADLEKRIKASHHRCGLLARKSEKLARERIVAAKETGDLLIQLKSMIVHGNWQPWVKVHCGISRRTACDYMNIAENWTIIEPLIDPKRRPAAVLSLKSILRHLAKRRAARDTGESGHSDTGATSCRSEPDQQADADPDDDPANASAENTANAAGAEDRPDRSESAEARRNADHDDADRRQDEGDADGRRAERADHRTCSAKKAGSARDDDETTAADPGATTRSEDQLDDLEWLETLAIRKELGSTALFDEDAIFWRSLRPGFDALTRLIEGRGRDVHKFVAEFSRTLRFPHRVSELLNVSHPRHWIACMRCSGKGRKKGEKKPCSGCDGAAYWVR
jgi:hypothetical protein